MTDPNKNVESLSDLNSPEVPDRAKIIQNIEWWTAHQQSALKTLERANEEIATSQRQLELLDTDDQAGFVSIDSI